MPRRELYARRSGGFDKGRRLIRLSAIGLPLGMPASARYEPPRGFPCQIRRGPGRFGVEARPVSVCRFFAPADRRQAPSLRERQREQRRARRVGGASGPAGRLETVQKVLTGRCPNQCAVQTSRHLSARCNYRISTLGSDSPQPEVGLPWLRSLLLWRGCRTDVGGTGGNQVGPVLRSKWQVVVYEGRARQRRIPETQDNGWVT